MDAGSEQGRLVVRVVKNPPLNAGDAKDTGSIPGSGRLPWRRKWQPTPVLLPGKFHGQRSLAGYSPRGCQELDTAEHTLLSRAGRGRRGASICCTCPKGGPAMRGYLVAVLLSAVCLYYVLHCILWRTNDYGVTPMDMKQRSKIQPCSSKPAFASLLRYHHFHPFLCAADFKNTVSFYGSDKFDLPYGIRASATYFRLALSKLQNCGLFDEFDNVPCKKCVVVGNGGILKNKTLGEKIDSYDIIIRMNNGPVLGHEEEVGRRTTFRLFYPESVFSDPDHNDPNTTVILTAFKPLDLKWLWELLTGGKINPNGFWKEPALNLIYKPYQIRILDPYITRMAAHELLHFPKVFPKNEKPKHPTTGIIAITLAFHICHEVHLAGFKYNFSDLKSPLHYYGNATMSLMTENEYHNVTAEQLFLKDIIEKNFVTDLTQQ